MASLLILGGMIPLSAVILLQYGLHVYPCHFCMLQRYPYALVILAGGLSLLVARGSGRWRLLVAIGLIGLLMTGAIGIFHTGIERGWIAYHGGCVAETGPAADLNELRAQVLAAPAVACNEVAVKFLGLSLASWNSLWAAFVALLVILQYRFDRKHHAG